MGGWEMLVALAGMACGTVISITFILCLKALLTPIFSKKERRSSAEIELMREEMLRLRQQSNDTILALDTTLQRLDHRMTRLENHASLGAPANSESHAQLVGRSGH